MKNIAEDRNKAQKIDKSQNKLRDGLGFSFNNKQLQIYY